MALILLANTKGGSGKTTAALVLAGELLTHNARIVLLEGDPNRPLVSWAETRGAAIIETSKHRAKSADEARKIIEEAAGDTERLVVIHDDDQEGVFEWIEGASAPSALDARQVSRTVQVLNKVAKRTGRAVNYRLLLTRANPIATRDEREIRQSLEKNGLSLLNCTLRERPAYRGLFKLDATMEELSPETVNGLDGARKNAAEFAREILDTLKANATADSEAAQ